MDGSTELKQIGYLLEVCADLVRGISYFQSHERDALETIASQLEGIADRLRSVAWRLRHLRS